MYMDLHSHRLECGTLKNNLKTENRNKNVNKNNIIWMKPTKKQKSGLNIFVTNKVNQNKAKCILSV